MKLKEILRWAGVLSFGGFGLYHLAESLPNIFDSFAKGEWGWGIFTILLIGVIAGVPLAISYFAFRRVYRSVTIIAAAVAALCVFRASISLQEYFGIQDYISRRQRELPWLIFFSLPLLFFSVCGPFYATAWFFRLCLRLADRYLHNESPQQGSALVRRPHL